MFLKPTKIAGLKDLLHKYNNFFFDLDGVIWLGDHQIKGSIEALNLLKANNKKIIYITNNSTRNPEEVKKKFATFGYQAQLKDIYTSSLMTALYMKDRYPSMKYVAAIGTKSLIQQLQKVGLKVLHIERIDQSTPFLDLIKIHHDPAVQALVVGYDKSINYAKICLLSLYIQKGAKFIGTNPDRATMMHEHRMPGCGSLIAALQAASGHQAQIVGKPNTFILDFILDREKLKKEESIMIGDNLETDISFGFKAGIHTLCTLSGVSNEELVLQNNIVAPTYYSDTI